jgi:uncharacterized membrane protein YdbT with pleckstrin-like domain
MGYVEQNLMPGEKVTYRATLHWIIYAAPLLLTVLGLILIVSSVGNPGLIVLTGLGVLVLLPAGLFTFSRWVTAKTSEFAVTNKRVIVKVGLIRRHTVELLLGKVESIGVDQNIVGRILGYGTIVVIGTGGTREPFKNIAEPLEFRRQVQAHALTA